MPCLVTHPIEYWIQLKQNSLFLLLMWYWEESSQPLITPAIGPIITDFWQIFALYQQEMESLSGLSENFNNNENIESWTQSLNIVGGPCYFKGILFMFQFHLLIVSLVALCSKSAVLFRKLASPFLRWVSASYSTSERMDLLTSK